MEFLPLSRRRPPRETSLAAKSEEKRMFLQARSLEHIDQLGQDFLSLVEARQLLIFNEFGISALIHSPLK